MVGGSPRTASLVIFFSIFGAAFGIPSSPGSAAEGAVEGSTATESTPPASKVVVILHSGQEKTAVRIAAESQSLGFEPMKEAAPSGMSDADLEKIAAARSATAVVWIQHENSVKVWVKDPHDPQSSEVQEVTMSESGGQPETLIAFKATELLRASLITMPEVLEKANTAPKVSRPAAPRKTKTAPIQTADNPRHRQENVARLFATLEPAAVFGFGTLPPSFNIGLSLKARITSRVFADIAGLIPTFPMETKTDDGTLQATNGIIRGGLGVALIPLQKRIVPILSVYGGGLILKVTTKNDLNSTIDETLFGAAVVGGSFGLRIRITKIIAFRLDADAGVALPTPVLLKGKEKITSFGKPLVSALLGIETKLF